MRAEQIERKQYRAKYGESTYWRSRAIGGAYNYKLIRLINTPISTFDRLFHLLKP